MGELLSANASWRLAPIPALAFPRRASAQQHGRPHRKSLHRKALPPYSAHAAFADVVRADLVSMSPRSS